MLAQCLDGVCRAGGRKAAAGGLKGRDAELIELDQQDEGGGEHPPDDLPGAHTAGDSSTTLGMTARERWVWFFRSAWVVILS